jgi:hypothetical protein
MAVSVSQAMSYHVHVHVHICVGVCVCARFWVHSIFRYIHAGYLINQQFFCYMYDSTPRAQFY